MSHYTKDYSKFGDDEIAKHHAAIQDVKDYLGEKKFTEITALARKEYGEKAPTLNQWLLAAEFAGVRGYPAKAWYNYIWPL